MAEAILTGAIIGTLIAGAIGGVYKEANQQDVYTFGDPAPIIEQWEAGR